MNVKEIEEFNDLKIQHENKIKGHMILEIILIWSLILIIMFK